MKILQAHNFYQQPGGEDQVYAAERDLLCSYGHEVEQYAVHNDAVNHMSGLDVACRTIWNQRTYAEIRQLLSRLKPDLVHCHNTFPLISPAIYYAARAEGVRVVQTLHNYRLICPAATLYRDGHVCEDCLHHVAPYDSVLHACYRGNRLASFAVASMLTAHRAARTWQKAVGHYIALTRFARKKLVIGGLPEHKISVKPNFLRGDILAGMGSGNFALFLGRLAEEKGIRTLLRAWEAHPEIPLRIAGDGPLSSFVADRTRQLPQVTRLGFLERSAAIENIRSAACVIIPSEWYEGFPVIVLEAMACGTPVIASDIGSLRELVVEDVTGLRFRPGDADHLGSRVRELLADPARLAALRQSARRHYETSYSREANYQQLVGIYQKVINGDSRI